MSEFYKGKIAFRKGIMGVEARLYNLVSEPKALFGFFPCFNTVHQADYTGSLPGYSVENYGVSNLGVRKWYNPQEEMGHLISTDTTPAETWFVEVPKPARVRLELAWTPTSACYLEPGWYKMTKKGWVQA